MQNFCDCPSDLGPWKNLFEDNILLRQQSLSSQNNTKQILILPRVTQKKLSIQKYQKTKYKVDGAIKINPLTLSLKTKNQNKLIKQYQQSQTISFAPSTLPPSNKRYQKIIRNQKKLIFNSFNDEKLNDQEQSKNDSKNDFQPSIRKSVNLNTKPTQNDFFKKKTFMEMFKSIRDPFIGQLAQKNEKKEQDSKKFSNLLYKRRRVDFYHNSKKKPFH